MVRSSVIESLADRVTEFYRHRTDEPLERRPYFVLDGASFIYLFDGEPASTEFVAEIIDGPSIQRQIGATTVRHARLIGLLAPIFPRLDRTTLPVPSSLAPDVIIRRSRYNVFDLDRGDVCKFPIDDDGDIRAEIDARESVPKSVPTPETLEIDRTFPFVRETIVDGRSVPLSMDSWPYIFEALRSLEPLYRSDRLNYRSTDELLEPHRKRDDRTIQRACSYLEDLSLPDRLSVGRIHGDLAPRNLRYTDDRVHIFDWQDYRRGLLIDDFFNPLYRIGTHLDHPEIFYRMVVGEGTPQRIAQEYSSELGMFAFENDRFYEGLPLLYLLDRSRFEEGRLVGSHSRLLRGVVELLDESPPF